MSPRPQDHELTEIARRIKAARLLRSTEETITAGKLAEAVEAHGLTKNWLRQLERTRAGEEPEVSDAMLEALESRLGIPRRWFTAPLNEIFGLSGELGLPLAGDNPGPSAPRADTEETRADMRNDQAGGAGSG